MNDLEGSCGGTGYLNCFCAGDFCACDIQGAAPCLGCTDCVNEDEMDFEKEKR